MVHVMLVTPRAGLAAHSKLDTPAAVVECVQALVALPRGGLKKSAVVAFGERQAKAIAKHSAVPKLIVYLKRVEQAVAEANKSKNVVSKRSHVLDRTCNPCWLNRVCSFP
jgi:hypothetical protein